MICWKNVVDVVSFNIQLCTILEERSLEVDALTLESKSVLFFELPSSFFFFLEEWLNSPKLAHEPRFIKLNYHSLNKMTEI